MDSVTLLLFALSRDGNRTVNLIDFEGMVNDERGQAGEGAQ